MMTGRGMMTRTSVLSLPRIDRLVDKGETDGGHHSRKRTHSSPTELFPVGP
jgi:hypothetical protein